MELYKSNRYKTMKIFKWFILATLVAALFSCSKSYNDTIEEEDSLDTQTRGETSKNDTTAGGGVNTTFTDWVTVSDTIVATEVPKDDVKSDSIPNDSIPSDSIPKNKLTIRR